MTDRQRFTNRRSGLSAARLSLRNTFVGQSCFSKGGRRPPSFLLASRPYTPEQPSGRLRMPYCSDNSLLCLPFYAHSLLCSPLPRTAGSGEHPRILLAEPISPPVHAGRLPCWPPLCMPNASGMRRKPSCSGRSSRKTDPGTLRNGRLKPPPPVPRPARELLQKESPNRCGSGLFGEGLQIISAGPSG